MAFLAVACGACHLLWADVVKLKNGGEVRGVLKESNAVARELALDAAEPDLVTIESLTGAEIVVHRDEIAFIVKRPRLVEEYESRARQVADTVEARWQLAEWCRQNRLLEARKEQLAAILELDPEHKPAHYGLGHRRQGDQWITPEEADAELLAAGYVRYKGRVITTLERDLLENGAQRHQEQNAWRPKIRLWLGWLNGRDATKRAEAAVNFRELRDPDAIPAVVDTMVGHVNSEVRWLAVQTLSQFEGNAAVPALVRMSLTDPDIALQTGAFQAMTAEQRVAAAPLLSQALREESNLIVRRAAVLLGSTGVRQAVPALIEALTTSHKIRVPQGPAYAVGFQRNGSAAGSSSGLPPDIEAAIRAGQIPQGVIIDNSGLPKAPVKWVTVRLPLQNSEVLTALRTLTKQDFGYDKRAWRLWWQAQQ
jgi:hypothetical protein